MSRAFGRIERTIVAAGIAFNGGGRGEIRLVAQHAKPRHSP